MKIKQPPVVLALMMIILFTWHLSLAGNIGFARTVNEVLSIQSKILKVTLDKSFPAIIEYRWIEIGRAHV